MIIMKKNPQKQYFLLVKMHAQKYNDTAEVTAITRVLCRGVANKCASKRPVICSEPLRTNLR